MSSDYLHVFQKVKHFMFDVDGVLTNSQLLLTEKGELLRSMTTRDGFAIKIALKEQYGITIITGGSSTGVQKRLSLLGITNIHSGIEDKLTVLKDLIGSNDLNPEEILYMGDDLPDIHVMKEVGLPCCPADAVPEIKACSKAITSANGGEGCVREIIEKVLKIQSKWNY
ncbi:MAG TPA: HAD hydrolase family protein [Bacteroidales bacterium]|nr:HAD hydrolase family protein [Bacteroidales bacterium]